MGRPSALLLILVILSTTAGTIGLVFAWLPVAECSLCKGMGRYIWKGAKDEVFMFGYKGGVQQVETRVIYPPVSSGCNLCYGEGRITILERRLWSCGMKHVEVGDLRHEGEPTWYTPGYDVPVTAGKGPITFSQTASSNPERLCSRSGSSRRP
jgi:hypothetical protein